MTENSTPTEGHAFIFVRIMADVILQFKKTRKRSTAVTGHVDVKATSQDIEGSGKSPNITSFARIRSAYVEDPDFVFIHTMSTMKRQTQH